MLPTRIDTWSVTSLQQRLVKTGGRLVRHAPYYWLLLAESHLTRRLFGSMLQRIGRYPCQQADGRALPETVGEKRAKAGEVSARMSESERGLSRVACCRPKAAKSEMCAPG
jgi:hypothetical protein